MKRIDAIATADLIAAGALLVDIRGADEHAREHIPGACHRPLPGLAIGALPNRPGQAVIFHCRSGVRTAANSETLAACVPDDCQIYLLDGGIDAWKSAGLPVQRDLTQPLELNRQVQIATGILIVLGTLLGFSVAPGWFAMPGAIGAGLIFAGVSGFCGLARVLLHMPWNRALRV